MKYFGQCFYDKNIVSETTIIGESKGRKIMNRLQYLAIADRLRLQSRLQDILKSWSRFENILKFGISPLLRYKSRHGNELETMVREQEDIIVSWGCESSEYCLDLVSNREAILLDIFNIFKKSSDRRSLGQGNYERKSKKQKTWVILVQKVKSIKLVDM